jgi:hypothetical protein
VGTAAKRTAPLVRLLLYLLNMFNETISLGGALSQWKMECALEISVGDADS